MAYRHAVSVPGVARLAYHGQLTIPPEKPGINRAFSFFPFPWKRPLGKRRTHRNEWRGLRSAAGFPLSRHARQRASTDRLHSRKNAETPYSYSGGRQNHAGDVTLRCHQRAHHVSTHRNARTNSRTASQLLVSPRPPATVTDCLATGSELLDIPFDADDMIHVHHLAAFFIRVVG